VLILLHETFFKLHQHCETVEEYRMNGNGLHLPELLPGTYVLKVRALTAAGKGRWSAETPFAVVDRSTAGTSLLVIVLATLFLGKFQIIPLNRRHCLFELCSHNLCFITSNEFSILHVSSFFSRIPIPERIILLVNSKPNAGQKIYILI